MICELHLPILYCCIIQLLISNIFIYVFTYLFSERTPAPGKEGIKKGNQLKRKENNMSRRFKLVRVLAIIMRRGGGP